MADSVSHASGASMGLTVAFGVLSVATLLCAAPNILSDPPPATRLSLMPTRAAAQALAPPPASGTRWAGPGATTVAPQGRQASLLPPSTDAPIAQMGQRPWAKSYVLLTAVSLGISTVLGVIIKTLAPGSWRPGPNLLQPKGQSPSWTIATVVDVKSPERELFHLTAEQKEVVGGMEGFVQDKVLPLANKVEKNWQPNDLLPDPQAEDFLDQVRDLRKRTLLLPDEYLVVLVGDMITEEALPTYMTMLNTLEVTRDETGASNTPWAQWTRKWTAEENRHGDALNKYLYLSGRVDMKAIESTIQRLIGSGMNPGTDNNPYLGYIYTSFQERATKVSHGNTARMAKEAGDMTLAKMCGLIAADEGRHEVVYQRIVQELFNRDPNGAMLALADMLRKQIAMPAHLMDDGEHPTKNAGRSLFNDFAAVADKLKVYTAEDYTDILEYLIKLWGVESITGLTPQAQEAQDYICKLPSRYRKLSARVSARKKGVGAVKFSWINDRELIL